MTKKLKNLKILRLFWVDFFFTYYIRIHSIYKETFFSLETLILNYIFLHIDYTQLRQGDLIFMGDKGESKNVNHVAIFDCIKDGRIYFIDATDKSGLNGVGRRSYPKNDSHFKYFGVMKLKAR